MPEETEGPAGFKILLADDNPLNQDLTRRLLNKRGHEVTVVENGRQALEQLERETFDLVLMDLEMPEMDGFEATRNIRRKETATASPPLTVVALTAYDEDEMADRIQSAGFSAIITKPIDPKNIDTRLREIVRNPGL